VDRPRIVSAQRCWFISDESMSSNNDLMLEIPQESNGDITLHGVPPTSESL